MARITKEERDKLDAADFGAPAERLFPVRNQEDLDSAAHLIGKAKDSDAVRRRLVTIAKRKNLTLPDAWEDDAKLSAEFGHGIEMKENFEAVGGTKSGPKKVRRKAEVLFRAGDYPFKHLGGKVFTMTPEDIMACCADFTKPVPIDDNHRPDQHPDGRPAPSYFKPGDFGEVVSLTPFPDYSGFGAEIDFPDWLDAKHRDDAGKPLPMPLSAHFDWNTRRLSKVALTPNPRIPDAAALFAAFAAEEAKEAKPMDKTPHGQKMMQFIHDHCAMHGATCAADHSPNIAGFSGEAEAWAATFTAGHELDTLQKVHDMTLGSGAKCAIYRDGMGKNKEWKPGQYYDTAVNMIPSYRDYRPGQYAVMTADPTPPVKPGELPAEAAQQINDLRNQLAVFTREREEEKRQAAEQVRVAEAARIAAEAVTFADALFSDDYITAAQYDDAVSEYREVAELYRTNPQQATFTNEAGEQVVGTPLDRLKARRRRHKHTFGKEVIQGGPDEVRAALFNREKTLTDAERDREDAQKKAEAHAAQKNKINGRQPAAN